MTFAKNNSAIVYTYNKRIWMTHFELTNRMINTLHVDIESGSTLEATTPIRSLGY